MNIDAVNKLNIGLYSFSYNFLNVFIFKVLYFSSQKYKRKIIYKVDITFQIYISSV